MRSAIYIALFCRKLFLDGSRKELREGEKDTGTERRGERKRKWRRD